MDIRTLLVDDEYLALDLLEEFLGRMPGYHIVAKLESPIEALKVLQSEPIDLLFLDIQMPVLSGANLLRSFPNPPVTIFTTAYENYAVEAFELNVVDYLQKPFSFSRFVQALNKANLFLKASRVIEVPPVPASTPPAPEDASAPRLFLTIKAEGKLIRVFYDEIHYVEGLREYVKVVTDRGNFVMLESLKKLTEQLPQDSFMRIHKSYIAALDRVEALEGNMLIVAGASLPVSRDRKQEIVNKAFKA